MCIKPQTDEAPKKMQNLIEFEYEVPEFAPLSAKSNRIYKITSITLIVIVVVSLLSFVFIGVESRKDMEPKVETIERTETMKNVLVAMNNQNQTYPQECISDVKEDSCNYTNVILLYGSFTLIASLILAGCFMVLLRCHKSESEEREKILNERLALYKEAQMAIIDIGKTKKGTANQSKTELKFELSEKITNKTKTECEEIINEYIDSIFEK